MNLQELILVQPLGTGAQLALTLAIFLGRMETANLEFVIGVLYGFSMVGNLAFIIVISKSRRNGIKGN